MLREEVVAKRAALEEAQAAAAAKARTNFGCPYGALHAEKARTEEALVAHAHNESLRLQNAAKVVQTSVGGVVAPGDIEMWKARCTQMEQEISQMRDMMKAEAKTHHAAKQEEGLREAAAAGVRHLEATGSGTTAPDEKTEEAHQMCRAAEEVARQLAEADEQMRRAAHEAELQGQALLIG